MNTERNYQTKAKAFSFLPFPSHAPFQNIFKFCTFLPKFSNILPFLNIFLPCFRKIACMTLLSRMGPEINL